MSEASFAILKRNCNNFIPAIVQLFHNARQVYPVWKTIRKRRLTLAPEPFRDHHESFSFDFYRQMFTEKNIWIDTKLSDEVSRHDLTKLMKVKQDLWRVMHFLFPAFCIGGYALPIWLFGLSTYTWVPSTFAQTEQEKHDWLSAQDLDRYRIAPTLIRDTKWNMDLRHGPDTDDQEQGWEELLLKNNVKRNPSICRKSIEMFDTYFPIVDMRRKTLRYIALCLRMPTLPSLTRKCIGYRVLEYWNLLWNEDVMIMTSPSGLSVLSDEELTDYAWRRVLTPGDKHFQRQDIIERIQDYHIFLGPDFLEKGTTPNMYALMLYLAGFYFDPAFLMGDIKELDEVDDFEGLQSWPKDIFLRRLEFENGPLRDQVEAFTQKRLEEKKLKP